VYLRFARSAAKSAFAVISLIFLAFAGGCGAKTETVPIRNWRAPDGSCQMNIPAGWRNIVPAPRDFLSLFCAPSADDVLFATITVEMHPNPAGYALERLIEQSHSAPPAGLDSKYRNVKIEAAGAVEAEGISGRSEVANATLGEARLKMYRAYFLGGSDFFVITCTALADRFEPHEAEFVETCRSFFVAQRRGSDA
jgi:hypothetical protein